jgi:hypothetical protein
MSLRPRRVAAAALAFAVALPLGWAGTLTPAEARTENPTLAWFDATKDAVATAGSPVQAPSSALWATAWRAADLAVARSRGRSESFAVTAFGRALHDVLADRVPAARSALDATLAATSGPGRRSSAQAVGAAASDEVLAERAGDGLDVSSVQQPYTPRAGAGFWKPTADSPAGRTAVQAGLGDALPYGLRGGDEVAVPPPPPLGTAAYRSDLAEVRAVAVAQGSTRTPDQTAVALFWEQSSLAAFTQVLRFSVVQLQRRGDSLADQVHLVAAFHAATTDAQIAVYAAKYRYERWRPITAIQEATVDGQPLSDGDPSTTPVPGWTSFFPAPVHPEYPSGHTGYAGAAEVVLDSLVGAPDRPVVVTSATAPGAARSYTDWATVVQENVDGRVWEGVHFRTSDVVGRDLGREVARRVLTRLG